MSMTLKEAREIADDCRKDLPVALYFANKVAIILDDRIIELEMKIRHLFDYRLRLDTEKRRTTELEAQRDDLLDACEAAKKMIVYYRNGGVDVFALPILIRQLGTAIAKTKGTALEKNPKE